MDINDADRMRVCKRCNQCINLLINFNKVKEIAGKIYYSHNCKKCTVTRRQNYMKVYHSNHYVSKKHMGDPLPIPNELVAQPIPDVPVQ